MTEALFDLIATLVPEDGNILLVAHGGEPQKYMHLAQDTWMRTAGMSIAPEAWYETDRRYDAIFLPLPKGKASLSLCLTCVAPLLNDSGKLYLFGANDAGIKSMQNDLKKFFSKVAVEAIGGKGRIYVAGHPLQAQPVALKSLASHSIFSINSKDVDFITYPGLFAKGLLDKATALLLDHLPEIPAGAVVLDYACGLGVLGKAVQMQQPTAEIVLVDYDPLALQAARQNVDGATLQCAAGPESINGTFDLIVSNPPIHSGQSLDYGIVERLVSCLPKLLRADGAAYLVTQVTVPVAKYALESKLVATQIATSSGFRITKVSR